MGFIMEAKTSSGLHKSISQYLAEVPGKHCFLVHDLCSPEVHCELRPNQAAIRQDRLIVIFQKPEQQEADDSVAASGLENASQIEDSKAKAPTWMAVSALSVSEYSDAQTKNHTCIYIEKLDSSGFGVSYRPKPGQRGQSVSRALVLGYLEFARSTIATGTEHLTVHVFARAQPEYIFRGSELNKRKNILPERSLVRWWMKTLSVAAPNSERSTGHWFVPGESEKSLISMRYQEGSVSWRWGWPYPANAVAREVIPRFADDPKTKVLSSMCEENTTVAEFAELLELTGDCGMGRLSAFFTLQLPSQSCVAEGSPSTAAFLSTFSALTSALDESAFSEAHKALKASSDMLEAFRVGGSTPTKLSVVNDGDMIPALQQAIEEDGKIVLQKDKADSQGDQSGATPSQSEGGSLTNLPTVAAGPEVLSVQNLVRKRTAGTQNIQNLVKRRK
ncbi:histone acetylation protein-domain-containing protein [Gaertneriomyces semiglobifer]|nr:histone acetylation protein-domain-containing protein [Gaertneriomyces semiglobifer]